MSSIFLLILPDFCNPSRGGITDSMTSFGNTVLRPIIVHTSISFIARSANIFLLQAMPEKPLS
ncbi:MAG TPA: hypothetical protein VE445_07875, partial [Nitrososphaeraceae archaeon]|nr:hypothetical protein [Nitrososphaeraceae archaeon]